MWPTINIDSCVLFQIRINHWEASVSLVVCLFVFLVLTPLSCLCFVLVSESSGQRKLGMPISAWNPGLGWRSVSLLLTSGWLRLMLQEEQREVRLKRTSVTSFSVCWLISIWREMLSDVGLLHRATRNMQPHLSSFSDFLAFEKFDGLFFFCILFSSVSRAVTAV